MIGRILALCLAVNAAISANAFAEPMGKWWGGFGQGTAEYGIKNDSAGSDSIYIVCNAKRTDLLFTVGGVVPKPGSRISVDIDGDEFGLVAKSNGSIETETRSGSNAFYFLWEAFRAGHVARVRLSTGQHTIFTLRGAARALPKEPCETDMNRY